PIFLRLAYGRFSLGHCGSRFLLGVAGELQFVVGGGFGLLRLFEFLLRFGQSLCPRCQLFCGLLAFLLHLGGQSIERCLGLLQALLFRLGFLGELLRLRVLFVLGRFGGSFGVRRRLLRRLQCVREFLHFGPQICDRRLRAGLCGHGIGV